MFSGQLIPWASIEIVRTCRHCLLKLFGIANISCPILCLLMWNISLQLSPFEPHKPKQLHQFAVYFYLIFKYHVFCGKILILKIFVHKGFIKHSGSNTASSNLSFFLQLCRYTRNLRTTRASGQISNFKILKCIGSFEIDSQMLYIYCLILKISKVWG